jgi:hypothetical protein
MKKCEQVDFAPQKAQALNDNIFEHPLFLSRVEAT